MMEVFSCFTERMVEGGFISGFNIDEVGVLGVGISHFYLQMIPWLFYGANKRLISQLGCRPGDLPSNDFRSPLGASFKQASSLLLHKQHQLLRGLSLLN
ncbi:hypothetical protein CK203_023769 [Vitis vinifera]|uniref:Uncharacterized protein n=1 Tax=Vitis vinifera TaxID=29760 RepID=A0A438JA40_VITVI|nr:hypothetical protein CK203_023769 [Vitis vinifera]